MRAVLSASLHSQEKKDVERKTNKRRFQVGSVRAKESFGWTGVILK
jgi:hypothetical protein